MYMMCLLSFLDTKNPDTIVHDVTVDVNVTLPLGQDGGGGSRSAKDVESALTQFIVI